MTLILVPTSLISCIRVDNVVNSLVRHEQERIQTLHTGQGGWELFQTLQKHHSVVLDADTRVENALRDRLQSATQHWQETQKLLQLQLCVQ
ncbi:hypothetical protein P3T76_006821 [Phytophthora citrophthora]|uniref:Uncharacterized protein n=1 Tax=Phytophthora citrophthora TaxID=4793 RepID=A0AAD9GNJ9_9STRA|nr:hypothetical protein P3T76_006821 [Phytophthora citrophthora]